MHDSIDFAHRVVAQCPSYHLAQRVELRRSARAPQCGAYPRLIEYPSQCQVNYALAIIFAREAVELRNCPQILSITRVLKFQITLTLIVANEDGLGPHPATQQTSAERSVGQGRDAVPETIRKHCFFALALK